MKNLHEIINRMYQEANGCSRVTFIVGEAGRDILGMYQHVSTLPEELTAFLDEFTQTVVPVAYRAAEEVQKLKNNNDYNGIKVLSLEYENMLFTYHNNKGTDKRPYRITPAPERGFYSFSIYNEEETFKIRLANFDGELQWFVYVSLNDLDQYEKNPKQYLKYIRTGFIKKLVKQLQTNTQLAHDRIEDLKNLIEENNELLQKAEVMMHEHRCN